MHGQDIQLVTVGRFGHNPLLHVAARNAESYEHRQHVFAGLRRPAAAVVQVAGGTRTGVEQGSETVARRGGRRCADPIAIEEGIADEELRFLVRGQVGQRLAKRLPRGGRHGRRATGQCLRRFLSRDAAHQDDYGEKAQHGNEMTSPNRHSGESGNPRFSTGQSLPRTRSCSPGFRVAPGMTLGGCRTSPFHKEVPVSRATQPAGSQCREPRRR